MEGATDGPGAAQSACPTWRFIKTLHHGPCWWTPTGQVPSWTCKQQAGSENYPDNWAKMSVIITRRDEVLGLRGGVQRAPLRRSLGDSLTSEVHSQASAEEKKLLPGPKCSVGFTQMEHRRRHFNGSRLNFLNTLVGQRDECTGSLIKLTGWRLFYWPKKKHSF